MSAPLRDEDAQPTQHPARRRVVELVSGTGPALTQAEGDSYIATVVASAPPLTHEQRDRLRLLLWRREAVSGRTPAEAQQPRCNDGQVPRRGVSAAGHASCCG